MENINLFQQINDHLDGHDINFFIKKKGELITVVMFQKPKINDDAKSSVPPVSLTGTAQELDQHLLEHFETPMAAVDSWTRQMQTFEKGMAEAEKASKLADQQKKEAAKIEAKHSKTYDKAKGLYDESNYRQAIPILEGILNENPDYEKAIDLLDNCKKRACITSLFDEEQGQPEANQIPETTTTNA